MSQYIDVSSYIISQLEDANIKDLLKYQEVKEIADLQKRIDALNVRLDNYDTTPKIEYA
jgi:hypothetical protein